MMARSVAQFLRDTATSKAAQRNYRRQAALLRAVSHERAEVGDEKAARFARYCASMAEHAARSEFFNPEPL